MKIYVLLHWGWDGDGYLSNMFIDVFDNMAKAKSQAVSESMLMDEKIYMPGEQIPEQDDGNYYTYGFLQIVEKEI